MTPEQTGRTRCQKLYPGPIFCEYLVEGKPCGKPAERHHKDENTNNNDRSNIQFLCRKHHCAVDKRGKDNAPLSEEVRFHLSEVHTERWKKLSHEERVIINPGPVSTSGVRYVTLHDSGRWKASIRKDGKRQYIGLFDTVEEAVEAQRRHDAK